MKTLSIIPAVFALVALTMVGCDTGPQSVDTLQPQLALSTTQQSILEGETTTIFAETSNLLGRDVQVNWSTTLGQVEPANQGRMARFTSDQPGTAVVTAEMNVDGRILREQININVNALR